MEVVPAWTTSATDWPIDSLGKAQVFDGIESQT